MISGRLKREKNKTDLEKIAKCQQHYENNFSISIGLKASFSHLLSIRSLVMFKEEKVTF